MNNKIVDLGEYKNLIEKKNDLDNKTLTVDDLSLEELEGVSKLYKSEISKLLDEVKNLENDNKILKRLLDK